MRGGRRCADAAAGGSLAGPARVARLLSRLLCVLPALLAAPPAVATDGAISPPPGERPVPVQIGLWLVDVSEINEITSSFRIETDVISSWRDPRLAFEQDPSSPGPRIYQGPRAQELAAGIWSPLGRAVNAVGNLSFGRTRTRPRGSTGYAAGCSRSATGA